MSQTIWEAKSEWLHEVLNGRSFDDFEDGEPLKVRGFSFLKRFGNHMTRPTEAIMCSGCFVRLRRAEIKGIEKLKMSALDPYNPTVGYTKAQVEFRIRDEEQRGQIHYGLMQQMHGLYNPATDSWYQSQQHRLEYENLKRQYEVIRAQQNQISSPAIKAPWDRDQY